MTASLPPRLGLRALTKSYAAPVLRGVDLDLLPGEIHALMGANGAGKSTLARLVCGVDRPESGAMALDGRPYRPRGRSEAEASGVRLVAQEPSLVGTLTVAENLALGHWPSRLGWIDRAALRDGARSALTRVGLADLDPETPASSLGIGHQQLVTIAAALARPCRVLFLDEPTAALTDPQVDALFGELLRLKAEGVAIVYVSHRLEELQRIADRISVLRDGSLVATRPAAELSLDEAVRLMVGDVEALASAHGPRPRGPTALRVDGLNRGLLVRDVSLTVHSGEVLGLSGLVGSGRTELLRCLFGADPATSGRIQLGQGASRPPFRHPRAAVAAGLGMVPEDRKQDGLLLPMAIDVNHSLARLGHFARGGVGWLDRRAERAASRELGARLQLVARSMEQPVQELSGGNQQKVVVGRWLGRAPEVYLLDEPTRGIDVGAKQVIWRLIDELARSGRAVIVASSETEELMALCDRIAVLSAGRIVEVFERGHWTPETLLAAAFREYAGRSATQEQRS